MSQTPTRATRAQELVERLTTIADAEELDEWGIRRLEREARALVDADAVAARTSCWGGVAALKEDVAAVREHHRIALQLSGSSVEALRNGAASLSRVGEMNEAFEAILQAYERIPDDPRHARRSDVDGGAISALPRRTGALSSVEGTRSRCTAGR